MINHDISRLIMTNHLPIGRGGQRLNIYAHIQQNTANE